MARGWESKSVESQMEERHQPGAPQRDDRSPDEREIVHRRESFESTRRGVLRELEAAKSELRRRSLEAALEHLDEELRKLG